MYLIGNIIYGVPLPQKVFDKLGWEKCEEMGFELLYFGSTNVDPGFCGIHLGKFEEPEGDFPLSKITFSPTDEQKTEAETMIDSLPDEVKKMLDPIDVYIVWSTS